MGIEVQGKDSGLRDPWLRGFVVEVCGLDVVGFDFLLGICVCLRGTIGDKRTEGHIDRGT